MGGAEKDTEVAGGRFLSGPAAIFFLALTQACAAPPQAYRTPLRSPAPPSTQAAPGPRGTAPESRPVFEETKIEEENLRERRSPLREGVRSQPPPRGAVREPTPLADESSLLAKITPQTSPRRAASLRLTEDGRRLLEAGEYRKALAQLERTISIDSTNAYGYYYLGKVHHHLTKYEESLNFLDVAESLFGGDPYWLSEVHALKGENFRASGLLRQAESSYGEALRLNSGNRLASEGMARLRGETQPSAR